MSGELRGLFGSAWTREGTCNGCGWCCEYQAINRHTMTPPLAAKTFPPSDLRYHQLRGGVLVKGEDGQPDRIHQLSHSYAPCSALVKSGVETRCGIYHERPVICRKFPEIPDQIEGTPCSYYFEAKDGAGNVFRRGGEGSPYPSAPQYPEPGDGHRD